MVITQKTKLDLAVESIINFWLEVRDDSLIYNFMEQNDVKKITVTIESTYVFELENDA